MSAFGGFPRLPQIDAATPLAVVAPQEMFAYQIRIGSPFGHDGLCILDNFLAVGADGRRIADNLANHSASPHGIARQSEVITDPKGIGQFVFDRATRER
jgi:hypothetical protein